MRTFKEFKQDCIDMVLECFDENFNDCKMAQELSQCDVFSELGQVMVEWEYWEMSDAIEYSKDFA